MRHLAILIFVCTLYFKVNAQFSFDLESGFYHIKSNDASSSWQNSEGVLNGLEGTIFSYAANFENPIKPLLRFRTNYLFGSEKRHFVSFLAAPLQYKCTGSFQDTIIFNSQVFTPGNTVAGFYKFSGYRITYRYMFCNNEKLKLGIGLTLNLRDAEFSLQQGDLYERNFNRGIVPLFNSYFNYNFTDKLGLLIDGDVFYIDRTGGAIDYLTGLSFKSNDRLDLKLGYRFFSGVGSEYGNVYNRLFVSSFVIGGIYQF